MSPAEQSPSAAHAPSTVVHVVSAGEVGGAERMLVDLASDATRRRHVIALRTPSDKLRRFFHDAGLDVRDRGPVRESPESFLVSTLGRADVAWVEHVVRSCNARIVHLHTFASQVLGTRAGLRTGARIVRTEHSTRVFDDPSCWPFSRWSLARAHASVAISEHLRTVAQARAPWSRAKLTVIPNGVDTSRFQPAPLPTSGSTDGFRFLALGRLDRRKGLDIALHALRLVPGACLHIVGEGEERQALRELAERLGVASRVLWTGFAPDVRKIISSAHVALSSARTEGLGIALLESMASGRPVVALPTGGIPEFVIEGRTGWLASHPTAEALAVVMQRCMQNTRELSRRGGLARDLIVQRYSLSAMREGYERLYRTLEA